MFGGDTEPVGATGGGEDIHRICGPAQNLWEQACLRRGRYIQHICFVRYTAFASKLAPTSLGTFAESVGQPPKSVGASLLAKRPVHPAHLPCQIQSLREQARSHKFGDIRRICGSAPKIRGSKLACEEAGTFSRLSLSLEHCLREQARSHGVEDIHRICGPAQNLWEQACLRRGRYIQHICFVRYTAFASKLAPTGPRVCRTCGPAQNLWEQACLRRGRYIQHICFAKDIAFASKLAPTGGEDIHRICGPATEPVGASLLAKGPVHSAHLLCQRHCLREQGEGQVLTFHGFQVGCTPYRQCPDRSAGFTPLLNSSITR